MAWLTARATLEEGVEGFLFGGIIKAKQENKAIPPNKPPPKSELENPLMKNSTEAIQFLWPDHGLCLLADDLTVSDPCVLCSHSQGLCKGHSVGSWWCSLLHR